MKRELGKEEDEPLKGAMWPSRRNAADFDPERS
jgi:hypothetical protein